MKLSSVTKYETTECNGKRSFVLGASPLNINYTIENSGKNTYDVNLEISFPSNTQFVKKPIICDIIGNISVSTNLICRFNPIHSGVSEILNISIDTSQIKSLKPIQIEAGLSFNDGIDKMNCNENNTIVDSISLSEFRQFTISR